MVVGKQDHRLQNTAEGGTDTGEEALSTVWKWAPCLCVQKEPLTQEVPKLRVSLCLRATSMLPPLLGLLWGGDASSTGIRLPREEQRCQLGRGVPRVRRRWAAQQLKDAAKPIYEGLKALVIEAGMPHAPNRLVHLTHGGSHHRGTIQTMKQTIPREQVSLHMPEAQGWPRRREHANDSVELCTIQRTQ